MRLDALMRRMLIIPLALLGLLGGAMIWSGGGAEKKADFRFINRGEIKTLDPNRMSWAQDIRIGLALWEGLYQLDAQTLEPVPGTAERIDVSEDKTVYTFHIRQQPRPARWSNGDPVRAQDFVFAWRRMLEEPGDYTYLFFYIKGAKEYQEAFAQTRQADFVTVGIEAVDERTLRVTLKHPVTFFADLCAFPSFFPLHEQSMNKFQEGGTYRKDFTKPPHLVSNGPYRLDQWAYKTRLRLVANEHYWDASSVRSRVIDQISAEDPFAAFQIYETGGVDWLPDVHPQIAAALRQHGRGDLRVSAGFGTYFYSINCLPKLPDGSINALADVRVRQALAMAIDKRPIVESVTRMGEPVTSTYIPAGVFAGYASPAGLAYDEREARRLLAEAGYAGGKGLGPIRLLYNSGAHHGDVAQIVRRQWEDKLGITVSLDEVEVKDFGERMKTQNYQIARASWIGDYNDPSTFTDKYLSGSDNNDAKWASAEYDALCAAAAVEADVARRLTLMAQAEDILLREAPIIPVYHYLNVELRRDNVQGIVPNPRNMQNFKAVGK